MAESNYTKYRRPGGLTGAFLLLQIGRLVMAGGNGNGRRLRNFTPVPNAAIEKIQLIGASAFCLYAYLVYRANRENDQAWPSYNRIMQDLNFSRTTISKAINILEKYQLIKKSYRRGTSNLYKVDPDIVHQLDFFEGELVQEIESSSPENGLPVVQKVDYSSLKNGLPVVQKVDYSSPENGLQVVQKMDLNKNQLTRDKEQNIYTRFWESFLRDKQFEGRLKELTQGARVEWEGERCTISSASREESIFLESRIGQLCRRAVVGISPAAEVVFGHGGEEVE